MAKTAAQLTKELIAKVNVRDRTVAKLNKEAKALRVKRDAALAKEAAAKKVARMSDAEKAAIAAELGV